MISKFCVLLGSLLAQEPSPLRRPCLHRRGHQPELWQPLELPGCQSERKPLTLTFAVEYRRNPGILFPPFKTTALLGGLLGNVAELGAGNVRRGAVSGIQSASCETQPGCSLIWQIHFLSLRLCEVSMGKCQADFHVPCLKAPSAVGSIAEGPASGDARKEIQFTFQLFAKSN